MPKLSGATQESLVRLLDQAATHAIIESLYLRFEVKPLPTDTNPNKVRKATHLVKELERRESGSSTLMSLINYVGSDAFNRAAFRRGSPESLEFYSNLDRDLERVAAAAPSPPKPERHFQRPGTSSVPSSQGSTGSSKRYVFVVRGRDNAAYDALAAFLRALDLRLVTWDDAARGAEGGTPHTLDIVRAGIDMADAVVVLMTPDDLGQVKPEFFDPRDSPTEATLSGQARQNVVFEAGWAMALNQRGVVLVRVGDVRPLSDIDGLNYVWLTGDLSSRKTLISRLRSCGLDVDSDGDSWRTAGSFPGGAL